MPQEAKLRNSSMFLLPKQKLITPDSDAGSVMISGKDLEHVAWLCRLELSEEEKEKYTLQFNSILDYFSQIDEVNTDGVEPTYHVLQLSNVFREDEAGTPACSLSQEEALENAPRKQDGFFKAPRMM